MDLTKRRQNLPVKPGELRKWILIGKVKLRAQIAAIKAINSIEEASAATQAALEDTQDLAEELLYAEAQMGAILKGSSKGTFKKGGETALPPGIDKKDSHFAQQLNRNENVIAEVVAEAREAGTIPIRRQVLRQINANKPKPKMPPLPKGKYGVVVIDPPWPMEIIERDCSPNQINMPYPTMTQSELAALNVPAGDKCHLFLWTTQRFLPMALSLVSMWGFQYVLLMVWHKPGGFQPFGLPQYNCEFVVYARKGSPEFVDLKDFPVCFSAKRGKHSEKPDKFYETIRRVTDGPRIDMFARRKISGFTAWGDEA